MDISALTPSTVLFKFIFPPAFYAFHGWIATEMAIWALFHPYDAWYFPGTKVIVPCTPGIFPKRRAKLAQAVASTVTETLLTTADIKAQAEHLVTERNIYIAIDAFMNSILKEFRDTTKLHRLASDLAELAPAALNQLLVSTIDGLENGQNRSLASTVEKLFDQVILSARISYEQSQELSNRLMETLITPAKVRKVLMTLLSPQNIASLDQSINAHASGPYKILAKIIGVKRVCYEWRNFLEKEPEESQRILGDLIKRFGLKDQIALQIANFDMRSLPLQTIEGLRSNLVSFLQSFLVTHRAELLEAVRKMEGEAMGTVRQAVISFNPESVPVQWLHRAKQDLAAFMYSYLQRELGELLEKAIPALGMYGLIARKIDLFSSQQLEELVKRVCKEELKWLAVLGGFIGGWLGLVQVAVNVAFP
jgi:uncharacterized membrane protein YheB (UPF0754 family)